MATQHADLARLEAALGHSFTDQELVRRALTHRSFAYEHPEAGEATNERLEFLGDAIFHFVVADELFERFPEAPEGGLTALRAALVCAPALAEIAESLKLGDHIRASRGEATLGGRGRQSILADAVEAVVAAVYRDGGYAAARALVRRLVAPRIGKATQDRGQANVKGRLQERIQASEGVTPFYRVVERSGPVHAEEFVVEVVAGDRVLGRGAGLGKRQAEQRAAREALLTMDAERTDQAGDPPRADAQPPTSDGEAIAREEVASA